MFQRKALPQELHKWDTILGHLVVEGNTEEENNVPHDGHHQQSNCGFEQEQENQLELSLYLFKECMDYHEIQGQKIIKMGLLSAVLDESGLVPWSS